MKSKYLLALIAIMGFILALPAQAANKPNILLIVSDDTDRKSVV